MTPKSQNSTETFGSLGIASPTFSKPKFVTRVPIQVGDPRRVIARCTYQYTSDQQDNFSPLSQIHCFRRWI